MSTTPDPRPERLDAIRKELYDIANSYSGDVTGDIVVAIPTLVKLLMGRGH